MTIPVKAPTGGRSQPSILVSGPSQHRVTMQRKAFPAGSAGARVCVRAFLWRGGAPASFRAVVTALEGKENPLEASFRAASDQLTAFSALIDELPLCVADNNCEDRSVLSLCANLSRFFKPITASTSPSCAGDGNGLANSEEKKHVQTLVTTFHQRGRGGSKKSRGGGRGETETKGGAAVVGRQGKDDTVAGKDGIKNKGDGSIKGRERQPYGFSAGVAADDARVQRVAAGGRTGDKGGICTRKDALSSDNGKECSSAEEEGESTRKEAYKIDNQEVEKGDGERGEPLQNNLIVSSVVGENKQSSHEAELINGLHQDVVCEALGKTHDAKSHHVKTHLSRDVSVKYSNANEFAVSAQSPARSVLAVPYVLGAPESPLRRSFSGPSHGNQIQPQAAQQGRQQWQGQQQLSDQQQQAFQMQQGIQPLQQEGFASTQEQRANQQLQHFQQQGPFFWQGEQMHSYQREIKEINSSGESFFPIYGQCVPPEYAVLNPFGLSSGCSTTPGSRCDLFTSPVDAVFTGFDAFNHSPDFSIGSALPYSRHQASGADPAFAHSNHATAAVESYAFAAAGSSGGALPYSRSSLDTFTAPFQRSHAASAAWNLPLADGGATASSSAAPTELHQCEEQRMNIMREKDEHDGCYPLESGILQQREQQPPNVSSVQELARNTWRKTAAVAPERLQEEELSTAQQILGYSTPHPVSNSFTGPAAAALERQSLQPPIPATGSIPDACTTTVRIKDALLPPYTPNVSQEQLPLRLSAKPGKSSTFLDAADESARALESANKSIAAADISFHAGESHKSLLAGSSTLPANIEGSIHAGHVNLHPFAKQLQEPAYYITGGSGDTWHRDVYPNGIGVNGYPNKFMEMMYPCDTQLGRSGETPLRLNTGSNGSNTCNVVCANNNCCVDSSEGAVSIDIGCNSSSSGHNAGVRFASDTLNNNRDGSLLRNSNSRTGEDRPQRSSCSPVRMSCGGYDTTSKTTSFENVEVGGNVVLECDSNPQALESHAHQGGVKSSVQASEKVAFGGEAVRLGSPAVVAGEFDRQGGNAYCSKSSIATNLAVYDASVTEKTQQREEQLPCIHPSSSACMNHYKCLPSLPSTPPEDGLYLSSPSNPSTSSSSSSSSATPGSALLHGAATLTSPPYYANLSGAPVVAASSFHLTYPSDDAPNYRAAFPTATGGTCVSPCSSFNASPPTLSHVPPVACTSATAVKEAKRSSEEQTQMQRLPSADAIGYLTGEVKHGKVTQLQKQRSSCSTCCSSGEAFARPSLWNSSPRATPCPTMQEGGNCLPAQQWAAPEGETNCRSIGGQPYACNEGNAESRGLKRRRAAEEEREGDGKVAQKDAVAGSQEMTDLATSPIEAEVETMTACGPENLLLCLKTTTSKERHTFSVNRLHFLMPAAAQLLKWKKIIRYEKSSPKSEKRQQQPESTTGFECIRLLVTARSLRRAASEPGIGGTFKRNLSGRYRNIFQTMLQGANNSGTPLEAAHISAASCVKKSSAQAVTTLAAAGKEARLTEESAAEKLAAAKATVTEGEMVTAAASGGSALEAVATTAEVRGATKKGEAEGRDVAKRKGKESKEAAGDTAATDDEIQAANDDITIAAGDSEGEVESGRKIRPEDATAAEPATTGQGAEAEGIKNVQSRKAAAEIAGAASESRLCAREMMSAVDMQQQRHQQYQQLQGNDEQLGVQQNGNSTPNGSSRENAAVETRKGSIGNEGKKEEKEESTEPADCSSVCPASSKPSGACHTYTTEKKGAKEQQLLRFSRKPGSVKEQQEEARLLMQHVSEEAILHGLVGELLRREAVLKKKESQLSDLEQQLHQHGMSFRKRHPWTQGHETWSWKTRQEDVEIAKRQQVEEGFLPEAERGERLPEQTVTLADDHLIKESKTKLCAVCARNLQKPGKPEQRKIDHKMSELQASPELLYTKEHDSHHIYAEGLFLQQEFRERKARCLAQLRDLQPFLRKASFEEVKAALLGCRRFSQLSMWEAGFEADDGLSAEAAAARIMNVAEYIWSEKGTRAATTLSPPCACMWPPPVAVASPSCCWLPTPTLAFPEAHYVNRNYRRQIDAAAALSCSELNCSAVNSTTPFLPETAAKIPALCWPSVKPTTLPAGVGHAKPVPDRKNAQASTVVFDTATTECLSSSSPSSSSSSSSAPSSPPSSFSSPALRNTSGSSCTWVPHLSVPPCSASNELNSASGEMQKTTPEGSNAEKRVLYPSSAVMRAHPAGKHSRENPGPPEATGRVCGSNTMCSELHFVDAAAAEIPLVTTMVSETSVRDAGEDSQHDLSAAGAVAGKEKGSKDEAWKQHENRVFSKGNVEENQISTTGPVLQASVHAAGVILPPALNGVGQPDDARKAREELQFVSQMDKITFTTPKSPVCVPSTLAPQEKASASLGCPSGQNVEAAFAHTYPCSFSVEAVESVPPSSTEGLWRSPERHTDAERERRTGRDLIDAGGDGVAVTKVNYTNQKEESYQCSCCLTSHPQRRSCCMKGQGKVSQNTRLNNETQSEQLKQNESQSQHRQQQYDVALQQQYPENYAFHQPWLNSERTQSRWQMPFYQQQAQLFTKHKQQLFPWQQQLSEAGQPSRRSWGFCRQQDRKGSRREPHSNVQQQKEHQQEWEEPLLLRTGHSKLHQQGNSPDYREHDQNVWGADYIVATDMQSANEAATKKDSFHEIGNLSKGQGFLAKPQMEEGYLEKGSRALPSQTREGMQQLQDIDPSKAEEKDQSDDRSCANILFKWKRMYSAPASTSSAIVKENKDRKQQNSELTNGTSLHCARSHTEIIFSTLGRDRCARKVSEYRKRTQTLEATCNGKRIHVETPSSFRFPCASSTAPLPCSSLCSSWPPRYAELPAFRSPLPLWRPAAGCTSPWNVVTTTAADVTQTTSHSSGCAGLMTNCSKRNSCTLPDLSAVGMQRGADRCNQVDEVDSPLVHASMQNRTSLVNGTGSAGSEDHAHRSESRHGASCIPFTTATADVDLRYDENSSKHFVLADVADAGGCVIRPQRRSSPFVSPANDFTQPRVGGGGTAQSLCFYPDRATGESYTSRPPLVVDSLWGTPRSYLPFLADTADASSRSRSPSSPAEGLSGHRFSALFSPSTAAADEVRKKCDLPTRAAVVRSPSLLRECHHGVTVSASAAAANSRIHSGDTYAETTHKPNKRRGYFRQDSPFTPSHFVRDKEKSADTYRHAGETNETRRQLCCRGQTKCMCCSVNCRSCWHFGCIPNSRSGSTAGAKMLDSPDCCLAKAMSPREANEKKREGATTRDDGGRCSQRHLRVSSQRPDNSFRALDGMPDGLESDQAIKEPRQNSVRNSMILRLKYKGGGLRRGRSISNITGEEDVHFELDTNSTENIPEGGQHVVPLCISAPTAVAGPAILNGAASIVDIRSQTPHRHLCDDIISKIHNAGDDQLSQLASAEKGSVMADLAVTVAHDVPRNPAHKRRHRVAALTQEERTSDLDDCMRLRNNKRSLIATTQIKGREVLASSWELSETPAVIPFCHKARQPRWLSPGRGVAPTQKPCAASMVNTDIATPSDGAMSCQMTVAAGVLPPTERATIAAGENFTSPGDAADVAVDVSAFGRGEEAQGSHSERERAETACVRTLGAAEDEEKRRLTWLLPGYRNMSRSSSNRSLTFSGFRSKIQSRLTSIATGDVDAAFSKPLFLGFSGGRDFDCLGGLGAVSVHERGLENILFNLQFT